MDTAMAHIFSRKAHIRPDSCKKPSEYAAQTVWSLQTPAGDRASWRRPAPVRNTTRTPPVYRRTRVRKEPEVFHHAWRKCFCEYRNAVAPSMSGLCCTHQTLSGIEPAAAQTCQRAGGKCQDRDTSPWALWPWTHHKLTMNPSEPGPRSEQDRPRTRHKASPRRALRFRAQGDFRRCLQAVSDPTPERHTRILARGSEVNTRHTIPKPSG